MLWNIWINTIFELKRGELNEFNCERFHWF